MPEWSTYELSDFLMFSGETYWRLVERHNSAAWPMQPIAVVLGVVLMGLVAKRKAAAVPAVGALLAAGWFFVGWAFHWQAYATINWGARYFAWAAWVQAMLLIGVAMRPGERPEASQRTRIAGLAIAGAGILAYPLATALAGFARAEVAGVLPDPTALATIGLLLATRTTRYGFLLLIPVLSLAVGWITRWLLLQQ